MKGRTPAAAAMLIAGAALIATLVPTICQAAAPSATAVSPSSAKVGATVTIKGSGFGSSRGTSTVTFGQRPNVLGFAPCSRRATVVSWSGSSIKVRVPSLAPGSHPVYVTVAGQSTKSCAFTVSPLRIISNRTFTTAGRYGNVLPSGHDMVYEGCTFVATNSKIAGTDGGVLCLGQNSTRHYNIAFRNCRFSSNRGAGSGADYGVNGIKLVDVNGSVHDITFQGCSIGAMSRMGFEAITAGYRAGLTNIALLNCTFEPCMGEAISFGSEGPAYSLVSGCTVKGYGNTANPQWGAAFEANGATHIVVRNTNIWAGRGAAINVNGPGSTSPCRLFFQGVNIDMTHLVQSYRTDYGARLFGCARMCRSRWQNCTFNTGNVSNHVYNAGWDGNWSSCHYNDFSGSTITGYCGDRSGAPRTAAAYWDFIPSDNILPKMIQ